MIFLLDILYHTLAFDRSLSALGKQYQLQFVLSDNDEFELQACMFRPIKNNNKVTCFALFP